MEKKRTNAFNLIAEIGCNHQGNINLAKELIVNARRCGCNIVKFQKRTPELQFTPEKFNAPHPSPENAFGKTYGEHRKNLEFNIEQHRELMNFARANRIEYSCSVFDIISAKELVSIHPSHIKIPSTCNHNSEIIEYIAKNFFGTIHVSLGMTTHTEEANLITILNKHNKLKNTVLYHCVSCYPVEDKDVCLPEITRLSKIYQSEVKAIGLSGHHIGTLVDCMALALGVQYIERHFTFDKNAKGSDHKISLNYDEMRELSEQLNHASLYLNQKPKKILDCELKTRKFHKENFITAGYENG